jgi:Lon protease-like protein
MAWKPEIRRANDEAPQRAAVEMPLFPLDLVLFPEMPQPLHIFEERYKELVNRCVREKTPFGIVLVTDVPAVGQEKTRNVGCSARITHVERLADGRMNILVVGERRFRIADTHEAEPYRTALAAPVDDVPFDDMVAGPLAAEVTRLLREFLVQSLARVGQTLGDFELPDEPEALSFAVACILPTGNDDKQALLEETDTCARLRREKDVLLREVSRLRRAAAARPDPEPLTPDSFAAFHCDN